MQQRYIDAAEIQEVVRLLPMFEGISLQNLAIMLLLQCILIR